ncbi:MAG: NADH-quinone oxidoreductase subunit C [Zoogloeaceae bacterium]|jgi:NADH-quinone oxidoreductase subunit C|nr:NADH-quinone oxidoreductase subunit C [Zoogloeaceae bacterium]
MTAKLEKLQQDLQKLLGGRLAKLTFALGEVGIEVDAGDYKKVMFLLRDAPELAFDQLLDLCGVDYSAYEGEQRPARRFAVVSHLLSMVHNWRLRVRVFAGEDAFPVVASVAEVWNSASWFEREAFDLFGIVFEGHDDLRRILTDYGFVGHAFRKDFPVHGQVEMRYDPKQGRIVYQPVAIEPRENTPRIRREATYGDAS